ncbi:MAG: BACON domain-containing protein, partial [Bacteroidales bacterium]
MKKLFSFLAVCLFVLVSCEPDPILSLDKGTLEFSAEGGSQTVYVTANNEWSVVQDGAEKFCTVSPASGVESGYITVTVQSNTTWANRKAKFTITCSSNKQTMSRTLEVKQLCVVGQAQVETCVLDPDENGKVPADGGTVKLTITANGPWVIKCDATDVTLQPVESTDPRKEVVATVPACPAFEGRTITFLVTCETEAGENTTEYKVEQAGGVLAYGGEVYHAAKMKDGKWWMTENLRYVPSGMTPSDDVNAVTNGIWYPVVIDELTPDKATVKFSKEAADIK